MANGGDWGGTKVDQEFKLFIEKIVGKKTLEVFLKNHKADALELFREFDVKKRTISAEMTTKLTFKFPVALIDCFKEQSKGQNIQDVTKKVFGSQVTWASDKIRLDPKLAHSFFNSSTTAIASHMKQIFQKKKVNTTNTIIMVGGYSESLMLVEEIQRSFPQKRFIIPQEAGLSVLKGAVIFAHDQSLIIERISKYTYGISCNQEFDPEKHPEDRKYFSEDHQEFRVKKVFDRHVEAGELLRVGIPQSVKLYLPNKGIKNGIFPFAIYVSTHPHPQFVDEQCCSCLGKATIIIPVKDVDYSSDIEAQLTFSGTEVKAKVTYLKTGQTVTEYFSSTS